jgi:NAD(P)-dependent dehydrogenase (short-subunit alcohol dehydrogenase family)
MASQVVMVTGASAGIGRAAALAFAARGARIGLLARGAAGRGGAREEVFRAGGDAITLQGDVADADRVDLCATRLEETFGPIDVWVNNAMTSVFSPVAEMTAGDYRRVTEVTYLGVVHGTLSALRRMRPRNRGAIVQVGSALAYRGIPLQSAYCAAKHAIQGFCDSLRAELLHEQSGVTLSMVQMPAVNTPQFSWSKSRLPHRAQPVPPIFQPEVAAQAICWAADHGIRELYVGLPAATAIVGNKVAPGLGDRYLARTGYASQQTSEPEDPDRPNNLYAAVDATRDFGTHGRFDDRARRSSWYLWAATHKPLLAAASLACAGVAAAAAARVRANAA